MKADKNAKERIIISALDLFYHQGFHQTTVRQIAQKVNVNQAMISYHFGSKKGLLEQLMVQFYEGYFTTLDALKKSVRDTGVQLAYQDRILRSLKSCFHYLFENYRMTRFIYRELSLDSTLIREIMSSYLAREKFEYLSILQDAESVGELGEEDTEMMVLQLLNLMYMPFLQPQVIREVYHIEPHSEMFKTRYWDQMEQWIDNRFK